eukprot:6487301-Amphidinium_carterae.6
MARSSTPITVEFDKDDNRSTMGRKDLQEHRHPSVGHDNECGLQCHYTEEDYIGKAISEQFLTKTRLTQKQPEHECGSTKRGYNNHLTLLKVHNKMNKSKQIQSIIQTHYHRHLAWIHQYTTMYIQHQQHWPTGPLARPNNYKPTKLAPIAAQLDDVLDKKEISKLHS